MPDGPPSRAGGALRGRQPLRRHRRRRHPLFLLPPALAPALLVLLAAEHVRGAAARILSPPLGCPPQARFGVGVGVDVGVGVGVAAAGGPAAAQAQAPVLVFRGALHELPLAAIRAAAATVLAFPPRAGLTRMDGSQDAALRNAVRSGVHVVLPKEALALYQAVTGKDPLFMMEPEDSEKASAAGPAAMEDEMRRQQKPGERPPLLVIRALDLSPGIALFDHDAELALSRSTGGRLEPYRNVELMLQPEQVRCAYSHLSCDYVATGEVFRKLCQMLRQEYHAREGVDLFKFAARVEPYRGTLAADLEVPQTRSFLDANRLRVETAYHHMVSRSRSARAPIKEVMYILYTVSDRTIQDAHEGKTDLARELSRLGARTPYVDALYSIPASMRSRWLSRALFLLGLACIGLSARRGGTSAYRSARSPAVSAARAEQAPRQPLASSRVRRSKDNVLAGPAGGRNAIMEYLTASARRVSKAH